MSRPKSFTIRKRTFDHLTGPRWEVDCGEVEIWDEAKQVKTKKRIRRFFKVKVKAEDFAREEKEKLKRHGETALGLAESDRILFQAARDRLAAAGATINQAVEFFLERHRPVKAPLSLRDLLERCVLDKEAAGLEDRSVSQLKSSCNSFIAHVAKAGITMAHEVTRDAAKGWILGNKFAPPTQRTYLGDLRTLLAWAKHEGYLLVNPIAGDEGFIQLAPLVDKEIEAFGPDHCRKLLWTALFGLYRVRDRKKGEMSWELAYRPLLGYLVVATFCGVRPAEVKRTTIKEMDLRERSLIIEGRHAKTNKRRVIELSRTAIVWLRLWRRLCPLESRFLPVNFDRKWKALRKAALIGKWPHDALRHTTATQHFAMHQNTAALQAMLGHDEDEDTLFRHYRAVRTIDGKMVTKKMAAEFWSLTPRKVRLSGSPAKLSPPRS